MYIGSPRIYIPRDGMPETKLSALLQAVVAMGSFFSSAENFCSRNFRNQRPVMSLAIIHVSLRFSNFIRYFAVFYIRYRSRFVKRSLVVAPVMGTGQKSATGDSREGLLNRYTEPECIRL